MKEMLRRVHSTAPIRICDIGGWTDTWFSSHGAVFSIAVKPYVEVQVTIYPRESEDRLTLNLENYGDTYTLNPEKIKYSKHPLIEAAIDSVVIPEDISIVMDLFSSAPAGASVGTSAAVTVALIGALDALTPDRLAPKEVAALAHKVETEKLCLQSGIQDQIGSAFGGINFIEMFSYPHSRVSPVTASEAVLWELENRLALFYIGRPHSSSEVHKKVIADLGDDASGDPRIDGLRKLAAEAKAVLPGGDFQALGRIMNESVGLQRALHPDLVCEGFEKIIEIAGSFDADGCKINGAGGDGGSITVLGNGDAAGRRAMIRAVEEAGFFSIPIALSGSGLRVWEAS